MDTFRIMQEIVGWLHILLDVAAVIICLMHFGRSIWARVLGAGFALQLLVSVFYRVASYLGSLAGAEGHTLTALYFMGSLLGLVAAVVIVVGLFGLFTQVAGMLARLPGGPPAGSAISIDPA